MRYTTPEQLHRRLTSGLYTQAHTCASVLSCTRIHKHTHTQRILWNKEKGVTYSQKAKYLAQMTGLEKSQKLCRTTWSV